MLCAEIVALQNSADQAADCQIAGRFLDLNLFVSVTDADELTMAGTLVIDGLGMSRKWAT